MVDGRQRFLEILKMVHVAWPSQFPYFSTTNQFRAQTFEEFHDQTPLNQINRLFVLRLRELTFHPRDMRPIQIIILQLFYLVNG